MQVSPKLCILIFLGMLSDKCHVLKAKRTVYFLGPGDGSSSTSEIMVIMPGVDPTIDGKVAKPFPYPSQTSAVYGLVGGVINTSITLCGGADHGGNVFSECFFLSSNTQNWNKFPGLLNPRGFATATAVLTDCLLVIGGRSDGMKTLGTSEVNINGRWKMGPSLPYPVEQHCSVSINSTHVFVIGGLGNVEPIKRFSSAFIMDARTGLVTLAGNMVNGERSGHGCSLLPGGQVMVVGGDSYPGDVGKTVEVYHIALNKWVQGPRLPEDINGSPGLVTDAGGRVFLIGGYSEEGISDAIYQGDGKNWWKIKTKMISKRGIFPVFEINSNWTNFEVIEK